MIIKLVLAGLLFLLFLYAVAQLNRSRPIAIIIILCCIAGIVFVFFPSLSTDIANALGVGRGADLVIYLLTVVTLAGIFNLHLRLRASREVVTELARALAISSARKPE